MKLLLFTFGLFCSIRGSSAIFKDLSCDCARSFKPVCGSDGATYDNKCLLDCSSRSIENLSLAYTGTCCPKNICPPSRSSVCDNFGRTHVNECVLQHVRCIQRKTRNKLVHKVHDGDCILSEHKDVDCAVICDSLGGPVCDEHGTTHSTECQFEIFNCKRRKEGDQELFLAHYGACDSKNSDTRRSTNSPWHSEETRHRSTTRRFSTPRPTNANTRSTTTSRARMHEGIMSKPHIASRSEEHHVEHMSMGTVHVTSNNIRLQHLAVRESKEDRPKVVAAAVSIVREADITKSPEEASSHPERIEIVPISTQSPADPIEVELVGDTSDDSYSRSIETDSSTEIDTGTLLRDAVNSSLENYLSSKIELGSSLTVSLSTDVPRPSSGQPFDVTRPCSAIECDKTWSPVCDSRQKTHKNLCLFKFYACKVNRVDGTVVELAHEGECANHENEIQSECYSCPKDEPQIPVCDNENTTHTSLCAISHYNCIQRKERGTPRVLVHIGECHSRSPVFELKSEVCPQRCNADIKPVCDEQGVTHRNLCLFQQKNCHIRKSGKPAPMLRFLRACARGSSEIVDADEDLPLPIKPSLEIKAVSKHTTTAMPKPTTPLRELTTLKPTTATDDINSASVVATTGVTDAENTTREVIRLDPQRFECPKPKCDGDPGLPICDSLGQLHDDICQFTYARCQAAQKGVALSIQSEENCVASHCNEVCSDDVKPVCGSDFSTYKNLCHFKKQRCKDDRLDIMFNGQCSECLESPCPHLSPDAPDALYICDEDGSTRTLCEFRMLSCIILKNYNMNLTIQHLGRCCKGTDSCTDKPDEYICGTDKRSYRNKCQFDIENCRNEKLELPIVSVLHQGECTSEEEAEALSEVDLTMTDDSKLTNNNSLSTSGLEQGSTSSEEKLIESLSTFDLKCPTKCDNTYAPVCGTDEVTYTNLCGLLETKCSKSPNIEIAYSGECCRMDCPNNFSPVCDDQGTTHQNLCFFGKERCVVERITGHNISIAKFDICSTSDICKTECPKTYDPICGTNGETLVNECELEKQNCFVLNNITAGDIIRKDYEGECCPDQKCEFVFSPVCDSDGTTHANECIFKQQTCIENRRHMKNVTIQYKGQCCNQPCENEYSPVCDGAVTHENMCRFRVAQCESERIGKVLTLSYAGECCLLPKGQCNTTGSVCDSDGQTNDDVCHFRQKKCVLERTLKKTLTVVHAGQCCMIESCSKDGDPVCDSRGGTHASFCHFQNTKCIHDKIHPHNSIQMGYRGACCPNNCNNNWEPVCDQHGSVYKNRCLFKLKSCELHRRSGGLLLETPCPERRAVRRAVPGQQITVT